MAIHRPEQWTATDSRLFDPCLKIAHRASVGIGAIRDTNLSAPALLIGLRPAQSHREAVFAECAIVGV
jgi:hypothetical protein